MKLVTIVFALLLATTTAQAQVGCYSLNSDPLACYSGSLTCYSAYSSNSYFYGTVVANLCDDIAYYANLTSACADTLTLNNNELSLCNSDYNALLGTCNVVVNQRDEAQLLLDTAAKKIKRLKKKVSQLQRGC